MTVSGHRLLTDADLAGSRPVSEAELQAAIANVVAMSNAEFRRAAQAIGLLEKQAGAAKPRKQRTALIRVVPNGSAFAAECGWCGWTIKKGVTFHSAQLTAHNHNRHAHRDHCTVEARVA